MCVTHSTLIDDPAQEYSVDRVLRMKADHLAAMQRERDLGERIVAVGNQERGRFGSRTVHACAGRWRTPAAIAAARADGVRADPATRCLERR